MRFPGVTFDNAGGYVNLASEANFEGLETSRWRERGNIQISTGATIDSTLPRRERMSAGMHNAAGWLLGTLVGIVTKRAIVLGAGMSRKVAIEAEATESVSNFERRITI